jgi:hypothetical protein
LPAKIGFPAIARFCSFRDVVAAWMPGAFGETITIGRVLVSTGDYILADIDGIIVIPQGIAAEVIGKGRGSHADRKQSPDRDTERDSPKNAYSQYGKFQAGRILSECGATFLSSGVPRISFDISNRMISAVSAAISLVTISGANAFRTA